MRRVCQDDVMRREYAQAEDDVRMREFWEGTSRVDRSKRK